METALMVYDVAAKKAPPSSQLPLALSVALDGADPSDLRGLLATLVDSLEVPLTGDVIRAQLPADPAIIAIELIPDVLPTTEIKSERPVRPLYDQLSEREGVAVSRQANSPSVVGAIVSHVLLPMTLVTSGLVLLMAWIR